MTFTVALVGPIVLTLTTAARVSIFTAVTLAGPAHASVMLDD